MKSTGQRFKTLSGRFAVCRLAPGTPIPSWAAGSFVSITSTKDEISVICPADRVPLEVQAERDWRVLQLVGPFAFTTLGVLASVAAPLANAGISILAVASYDTDYFLVKDDYYHAAVAALAAAGHEPVS